MSYSASGGGGRKRRRLRKKRGVTYGGGRYSHAFLTSNDIRAMLTNTARQRT